MKNMNTLQGFDIVIGFHHFLADRAIHLFFFPLFLPFAYFFIILCDILESTVWRHKVWFLAELFGRCFSLRSVRGVEEPVGWDRVNYQPDFIPRKLFRSLFAVIYILVRILSFFLFMS